MNTEIHTDHTAQSADVVVMGGGIIGLSVAYEAIRAGYRVIVLERERVGAGAGRVAAGMVALAMEAAEVRDRHFADLAAESCRLYPEFVRAIEADSDRPCGYRTEGSLLVALHQDHQAELERTRALQKALGIEAQRLGRTDVLQREPGLSPRVTGGLFMANDYQVDPRALCEALALAIVRRGGSVVPGANVTEIATDGRGNSKVSYECEGVRTLARAQIVVVAAGSWSNELLALAGEKLPLRPVKGQTLRLRGEALIRHVVRTPDVYLVPRANGELVVGATTEDQGFDHRPMAGAVLDLLLAAWRVLPGIYDLEVTELSVGFRPALRDNLPAIGPSKTKGLFVATGHYRHGVLLAPATARLLVQWLQTCRIPLLLEPFGLDRISLSEGTVT